MGDFPRSEAPGVSEENSLNPGVRSLVSYPDDVRAAIAFAAEALRADVVYPFEKVS